MFSLVVEMEKLDNFFNVVKEEIVSQVQGFNLNEQDVIDKSHTRKCTLKLWNYKLKASIQMRTYSQFILDFHYQNNLFFDPAIQTHGITCAYAVEARF